MLLAAATPMLICIESHFNQVVMTRMDDKIRFFKNIEAKTKHSSNTSIIKAIIILSHLLCNFKLNKIVQKMKIK